MSEVAGRLAPQVGAYHLMRPAGGRGVLMGGVPGVHPANVVVIGGGVSGQNATTIALGMQADVTLLDKSINKLRQLDAIYQGKLKTDRVQRVRDREGRRSTPTSSSARCWCPVRRRRRWSPTNSSRG